MEEVTFENLMAAFAAGDHFLLGFLVIGGIIMLGGIVAKFTKTSKDDKAFSKAKEIFSRLQVKKKK